VRRWGPSGRCLSKVTQSCELRTLRTGRKSQVERARYDADVAQRRFLRVDPENRLVADALEAAWNDRLRALAAAQETYEHTRAADARVVSEEQRAEILALANSNSPWHELTNK
jgi:hypothetical protein